MAVELKEPALQLMTFIENNREPALGRPLHRRSDHAAARRDRGRATTSCRRWGRCWCSTARTSTRSARRRSWRAAWCSSTWPSTTSAPFNKFITYYLFPEARYSVGLTAPGRSRSRWARTRGRRSPRTHDISAICERYGGGGHPVVGAVSVPRDRAARARGRSSRGDRRRAAGSGNGAGHGEVVGPPVEATPLPAHGAVRATRASCDGARAARLRGRLLAARRGRR